MVNTITCVIMIVLHELHHCSIFPVVYTNVQYAETGLSIQYTPSCNIPLVRAL